MKIGVIADPPLVTHSCAVVCSQLAKQWVKMGHKVAYLGYGYTGDKISHPDGYDIYPDIKPCTSQESVSDFIQKTGSEILFAHGSKDIFRGGMAAAKAHGIPYVPQTFYSTPYKNDKVNTFEAKKGFILYDCEQVDDMVVCNNFSVGVGFALGKRTWFIPNGIDPEIFYAKKKYKSDTYREELGIPEDALVFLFSGSNLSGKDPGRALEAFAQFRNGTQDKVYLAMHTRPGDNPGETERGMVNLRQIAHERGVSEYVKFFTDAFPKWLEQPEADKNYRKGSFSPPYTTTPYRDMGKVFRTGNVLLAPTLMEGMSTTILEAQACGLPVICSDDAVVSEPVVHYSTGMLVHRHLTNENKTNEIVDAMNYFYHRPEEIGRMGFNAEQLMKIKYNWQVIAKQFIYLFNTVLHQKYK